ncbi:UbiD family decarboxylase [Salipiger marinus]|uniref:UbiD family decarboxylase n=1 Tax=Salipiger marinus TaxID=555512 RepID=UPI002BDAE016|nr:UbiD family decarboxylase [Salipiger manganoxidans]MEB3419160.1 UbiD family decarboxylase [Salipiger manganoxidans]
MTNQTRRAYNDLHDHIAELDRQGLLIRVDREIDKDAEMHPLVRWQFVGGMKEADRKAFLFTNIRDGKGRAYEIPVIVGGLAANPAIYAVGMDCPVEEIGAKWKDALAHPIPPREVEAAPCHDIVETGGVLSQEGHGIDILPIPVSTPGFDSAPTLSATNVITVDPETGVQNMGTYRCALKAPDRLVVRMATRVGGAGGYQHYLKHQQQGDTEMPVAIVLGCPPCVAFMGPQKLPIGVDEFDVAGGLAGHAVDVVRARTVPLLVPAEAEVVIEGYIDVTRVEPEGPFGESHGHIALEEYNMPMRVTAVTRRRDAVIPSYISQVAPSESSVIKRVAYEPLFLSHLRDTLSIKGIRKVSLHEPLTGLLRVTVITVDRGIPRTEIWRALYGAAFFKGDCSKICIAVDEDIDVDSPDSILWAMSYRTNPVHDMQLLPHRGQGHGPKREHAGEEDSTLLIDATMKSPMPPLALPTRPYMERARTIWEEMGLPPLMPQSPWHGYSLGAWHDYWEAAADRAARGGYLENGKISLPQQRPGLKPETKFDPDTGEPM